MRIAFLNRGRSHPGGDVIALDATMDALRRLGVECEETGWDVERIKAGEFDLCHAFHCQFGWALGNYRALLRAFVDKGIKWVLTPVFYEDIGGITDADEPGLNTAAMIAASAEVTPFSERERHEISNFLKVQQYFHKNLRFTIIPNGTDPMFHNASDAMKREGVLCVSARGPSDKNIPMVRDICESLRLPFTHITGIPHDQLPPIYAAHRLFVNASDSERMSLTAGEALCSGCRVVASHGNRGNEHYPGLVVDHITKDLIARSYHLPDWNYYPNHAARQLTWDLVAERLLKVYEEVVRG